MSTITAAAAALDTTIATLATQTATLVAAIQASQTTYQNANPNRYQQGLATFEENIRASILGSSTAVAQIMRAPPQNPAPPALATQFAAF